MIQDLSLVETAIKKFYIGNDGKMYFQRFAGDTSLVGTLKQEADYTQEDVDAMDFVKNRPLLNANVKNRSLRVIDGDLFIGSSTEELTEIYSPKKISSSLTIIPFKTGRYYSSGDIVAFNNQIWLKRDSGFCSTNPSVDNTFKIKKSYNLVKHVCELEDTRLSAVIVAKDETAYTTDINSIFDLYFTSSSIVFNGEPEDLKDIITIAEKTITLNVKGYSQRDVSIVFTGKKTISFDLMVSAGVDSTGSFRLISPSANYVFETDADGILSYDGTQIASSKTINDIIINILDGETLEIALSVDNSSSIDVAAVLSNLTVTTQNGAV